MSGSGADRVGASGAGGVGGDGHDGRRGAAVALTVHVVLDDRGVDAAFDVAAGECVALVGPNGAGKSSVVEVVAGLLVPSGGGVATGSRELVRAGRPLVPAHRRDVGLVGQDPSLFPHLSVLANVAYGPRARGASRRSARSAALAALDAVGAAEFADRAPSTLSGGQAQRVAIARALATDPSVLLLDEPTSALDVAARQEVRGALRTARTGRTTVLVTHDPVEVVALADRVVVLEDGRVVEHGTVEEVLEAPRSTFGAAFSGLVLVPATATAHGIALDPATGGGGFVCGTGGEPPGRAVVATYHPAAARIVREGAGPVRTVTSLEPRDGLVRVRCGELVVDATVATVRGLGLAPGDVVRVEVPGTELTVRGAGG